MKLTNTNCSIWSTPKKKELEKERKRWQDKEREYEKALVSLTAELRELKLEHTQSVETHEAFRAHVDAKESARTLETSSFEIKKQALQAEHQLALRQSQAAQNSKNAQLERQLLKLQSEVDDLREENERLSLALESGGGGAETKSSRNAYLYEDEPREPRQPRQPKTETRSEPAPEPTHSETQAEPAPQAQESVNVDLNVGGVEITGEATF